MKQFINLYQVETEEKVSFPFQDMMKFLALFLGLLVLLSLYQGYNSYISTQNLKVLEKQQATLAENLKKNEAKVPDAKAKEKIYRENVSLEEEQKVKRAVLATLVTIQVSQTEGFSRYLRALAKQATPDAWLTSFVLSGEDRILLIGLAIRPNDVPKLIDGLSKEPVFKGKTFEVFKLETDNNSKYIKFSLESKGSKK